MYPKRLDYLEWLELLGQFFVFATKLGLGQPVALVVLVVPIVQLIVLALVG